MGPFADTTHPRLSKPWKDISPELMGLIHESFDDLEGSSYTYLPLPLG